VRALRLPVLSLTLVALCGCRFTADIVGAAAGGASGAATANPVVGIAVGVAVDSAIDASFAYFQRKRQQAEQDAIAEQIATMRVGDRRPWKIEHDIPIGNEHGEVEVIDLIVTPLTLCKGLVFSVQSEKQQHWYSTQACDDGNRWKWALAEPAAERWEPLQ